MVEDGPDRPPAVPLGLVPGIGHGCREEVVAGVGLAPEAPAGLVDEDDVLPVGDGQAGRAGQIEDAAVRLPDQARVAPLASDVARLGDRDPLLDGLVGGAPQRRPDGHRRELSVPALAGPRLAGDLILLGQPRVEGAPEIHVAGAAAGGDEEPLGGPDVHGAAVVDGADAEHPPPGGALADDARHLVAQQHLGPLGARAGLEGADETGADPGRVVRHPFAGDGPLHGALLPAHLRGPGRTHEVVLELDPVLDEELEGRRILVREGPDEVAVAVAALPVIVAHPVQIHLVRGVVDPVLALIAGTAAEVDVAPGAHAVPADVDVLLEHDHGGAVVEGGHGGGEPRGAGADGDEVRRPVPEVLGLGVPGSDPGQCGRADPRGGAAPYEGPPTDARVLACRFAHLYPPSVPSGHSNRGGRAGARRASLAPCLQHVWMRAAASGAGGGSILRRWLRPRPLAEPRVRTEPGVAPA